MRVPGRGRRRALRCHSMSAPISDSEITAAVADLPPVSVVLQRLLEVLRDAHASVEDLARLVRAETVLAGQVLRVANSAFFGLPEPAATVDEAIQRLGVTEVSRLVTVLASRRLFLQPLRTYAIGAEALWQHTLAVAACGETVASYAEVDRGLLHLAGILHPVGLLALERLAVARGLSARSPETPLLEWEMKAFGTDNATVAARVLRHWQLPELLTATVGGRYAPEEMSGEAGAWASRLHLASLLAERIGGGLPGERGCFSLSQTRFAAAGMAWDAFAEAEVEAGQNLERARALLRVG